jgi:hypothetical protein
MVDSALENLVLDLLEWLARRERTYEDVAHVVPQIAGVGRSKRSRAPDKRGEKWLFHRQNHVAGNGTPSTAQALPTS